MLTLFLEHIGDLNRAIVTLLSLEMELQIKVVSQGRHCVGIVVHGSYMIRHLYQYISYMYIVHVDCEYNYYNTHCTCTCWLLVLYIR